MGSGVRIINIESSRQSFIHSFIHSIKQPCKNRFNDNRKMAICYPFPSFLTCSFNFSSRAPMIMVRAGKVVCKRCSPSGHDTTLKKYMLLMSAPFSSRTLMAQMAEPPVATWKHKIIIAMKIVSHHVFNSSLTLQYNKFLFNHRSQWCTSEMWWAELNNLLLVSSLFHSPWGPPPPPSGWPAGEACCSRGWVLQLPRHWYSPCQMDGCTAHSDTTERERETTHIIQRKKLASVIWTWQIM